jgi:hypothetical protein
MQSTRYACRIVIKASLSRQSFENTQISNFMKIRQLETKLFRTDEETDR